MSNAGENRGDAERPTHPLVVKAAELTELICRAWRDDPNNGGLYKLMGVAMQFEMAVKKYGVLPARDLPKEPYVSVKIKAMGEELERRLREEGRDGWN